jgi:hypothetical protein
VNVGLQSALSVLSDSVNTRAVSVWTGVARGGEGRTRVSFTWEANPGGNPADKPARVEIQPIDEAGKESMPTQVIGGAPGELPLIAHFDFAPGRQRIRFTTMATNGDIIDRWVQTQAVPDLSKETIVLSTPRFLRARSMVEFRAIEANPQASPTALMRFGPTDRVLIDLQVQAADGAAPQIKVDLLNGKGDLLKPLEPPALTDGRLRMPLPVASLANSTYVLRVEATAGEQSTQQWVAFRIAR